MLRSLITDVKYNEKIKNPFTLCWECSKKEREGSICDPECTNLGLDLIDKKKGYSVYNLTICLCKDEQKIRLKCLLSQEWTKDWFSTVDILQWLRDENNDSKTLPTIEEKVEENTEIDELSQGINLLTVERKNY